MDSKGFSFDLPPHLLDELEDIAADTAETAEMIAAVAELADLFSGRQVCSAGDETLH